MRHRVVLAGLALLLLQGVSNGAPNAPVMPAGLVVDGYRVAVAAEAGGLSFQRLGAGDLPVGEPWIWPAAGFGDGGRVRENPRLIAGDGETWLTFTERGAGEIRSGAVPLSALFGEGFAGAARRWAEIVPLPAVGLTIGAPFAGEALGESTPVLRAFFETPTGIAVAPETLAFFRDGEPLEVACSPIPGGAECTPILPFADGEVTLEARVADVAGYLSPPVTSSFTIDTAEPFLHLQAPAEGFLVASSSLLVSGYLSEPAALSIGGIPVELTPELTFEAEIPLQEGANVLLIEAVDAAGNTAVAVLTGSSDTLPPPPLAAERVAASHEGHRLSLVGAPGAAESHARVRWKNSRTGQEIETLARVDGSFEAALAGAAGDLLEAVVVDAFDNASLPAALGLPGVLSEIQVAEAAGPILSWPYASAVLPAFADTPCLAP